MDIEKIVDRLRRTIVAHPYYELTFKRLYNHCAWAQPGTVITLVGPTRVGKTMLSHRLANDLVSKIEPNADHVPIVRVEAAATDRGCISSRYLVLQLLAATGHPFHADGWQPTRTRDSESDIRVQLMAALKYRQTKYIIFDEAHHLLRTRSDKKQESVLDSMKSLGNDAKCVILFVAGYEILRHQFQSAHLDGRLLTLEFPNYGLDEEGRNLFWRLLATLDSFLPWTRGETLLTHREMIYQGTAGCYGQLVHWTIGALAEMAAQDETALRERHFLATRNAVSTAVIRQDIEEGKRMLAELPLSSTDPGPTAVIDTKPRRRPFKRLPKRDPVARRRDP